MGDEVDFLRADKHENFLKMIVSLWACVAGHAQSIQNNKFLCNIFAISQ